MIWNSLKIDLVVRFSEIIECPNDLVVDQGYWLKSLPLQKPQMLHSTQLQILAKSHFEMDYENR